MSNGSQQTPRSQFDSGNCPPPGMVWQDFAMGGGQWVRPSVVTLTDEDVERIARAVVRMLKAEGARP